MARPKGSETAPLLSESLTLGEWNAAALGGSGGERCLGGWGSRGGGILGVERRVTPMCFAWKQLGAPGRWGTHPPQPHGRPSPVPPVCWGPAVPQPVCPSQWEQPRWGRARSSKLPALFLLGCGTDGRVDICPGVLRGQGVLPPCALSGVRSRA